MTDYIKELRLERYGKFRDRHFVMAPVTLFLGENESGKTTLFDALTESCCRFPGQTTRKRRLDDRYGKERQAAVIREGNKPPEPVEEDHFFSVFALSGGDLPLNGGQKASWLQEVQARLFSGGIDPSLLAARLEELCSADKRSKSWKRMNQIREDVEDARQAFQEIAGQLELLEAHREKLWIRSQEKSRLADRCGVLKQEFQDLSAQYQEARQWEELRRLQTLQEARIKGEMYQEKRQNLRIPGGDVLERGEALEAQEVAVQEQIARSRARISFLKEKGLILQKKVDEIVGGSKNPPLATLVPALEKLIYSRNRRSRTRKGLLGAGMAFAAALGFSVGSLFQPEPLSYALGGAGFFFLCLSPILFFSFSRRVIESDSRKTAEYIKAEWLQQSGGREALQGWDSDQILREMEGLRDAEAARLREEELLGISWREYREELSREEQTLAAAEVQLRRLREERYDLWKPYGCHSLGEARELLEQVRQIEEALEEQNRYLLRQQQQEGRGSLSLEAVQKEWKEAYLSLRDNLAGREEMTIAQTEALRRQQEEAHRRYEEAERQLGALENELSRLAGELEGGGDIRLQETYHRCQRRWEEAEEEWARITVEREAADLSASLFRCLAREKSQSFEELSAGIGESYADLVGREAAVTLNSLNLESSVVADAQGQPQALKNLSEGTRDSYYLACRLLLAKQSEVESPLVLDDPFLTLDQTRLERFFQVLADFQEETGRQIIIFSKEAALEREVDRVFKGRCRVIHLGA